MSKQDLESSVKNIAGRTSTAIGILLHELQTIISNLIKNSEFSDI